MTQPQSVPENGRRKRILTVLTLAFVAAGLAYGAYWGLHGRYHESTDDAYVAGNLLRVTPRVAGTVTAVLVDDTDFVKRGQVLVKLEDTDARVALQQAEANLANTVRQVRQLFDLAAQEKANVDVKTLVLQQAQSDVQRRAGSDMGEAVSREEVEHAKAAEARARAELELARAALAGTEAQVADTTVAKHPAVQQAAEKVRAAWLTLERCNIRAAEDGYIAQRSVQVGQQLAVGTPLMVVVPLHQLWVEANFKEDQLKRLRIGQPVELDSDLYGGKMTFHGKVVGLAPGTGSVFSLLPPQNATGNWIKIVQRVPVRVALDEAELSQHPLRVGLSMNTIVDTRDTAGPALASGSGAGRYETTVYSDEAAPADKLVQQIIAANQGKRG